MRPTTLGKYFAYLDRLRESGVTNMYGAGPYLEAAYGISREKSTPVVRMWMQTFDRDTPPAVRAKSALSSGEGRD